MSVISLTGGAEGNLARRADVLHNGADADTVNLIFEATARSYNIFTHAGNDTVNTILSNTRNVNAAILGAGDDKFNGGNASDTVYDGTGNDVIKLGGGSDMARVSDGRDTYEGGAGSDILSFAFLTFDGNGAVVNNSIGVTCDLALTTRQDFGAFGSDLVLGFEGIGGGDGSDAFYGGAGSNALYGMGGNDKLFGRGGHDKLNGGFGNDELSGGLGKDLLIGEDGGDRISCGGNDSAQDMVKYRGVTDSGLGGSGTDEISGFIAGGKATSDRIDLSLLDANAATKTINESFSFRASGGFKLAGGEVRVLTSGSDCIVLVDTDSDPDSEMQILIHGLQTLTAADFIL